MKNNFLDTFTKFLKQLNVPVTESSALEFLETHPDEGSMLAYADALNHFKIENAAIRIKQEDLTTLPTPFIAFSQIHGGTFSVVKNLTENTIEWFDTQKGWVKDKIEDFTKTWSGVVLLAETDEKSGEKNYTLIRRDEILKNIRIPIAVTLITLIFLFFILNAPLVSTATYILLVLKAIGMVISTLLFVKSIDNANNLVNKLCNAGSKISCQSILDSPAAKITPWFSWSDAGFIYFFGSFLGLLFSLGEPELLNSFWTFQVFFSFCAMIFSSYSLYYQAIKAKMWCTLCLGVLVVLFLETFLLFLFRHQMILDADSLLKLGFIFLLPIAFLLLFKSVSIKAQVSQSLETELNKLKSNPKILEALFDGQPKMYAIPEDMPIITIGNPNAKHKLTIISNPLCNPCSYMHTKIESLLAENENFNCDVVFLSSTMEDNLGGRFVRKLFSLPIELQHSAMNSWFNRNNNSFENWNKAYSQYSEFKHAKSIQNQHNMWANLSEVRSTPTVYLNHKLIPIGLKIENIQTYLVKT